MKYKSLACILDVEKIILPFHICNNFFWLNKYSVNIEFCLSNWPSQIILVVINNTKTIIQFSHWIFYNGSTKIIFIDNAERIVAENRSAKIVICFSYKTFYLQYNTHIMNNISKMLHIVRWSVFSKCCENTNLGFAMEPCYNSQYNDITVLFPSKQYYVQKFQFKRSIDMHAVLFLNKCMLYPGNSGESFAEL